MSSSTKLLSSVLFLPAFLFAIQSAPAPSNGQLAGPEAGYTSSGRYVNTYFGFSLPLPRSEDMRNLSLPSNGTSRFIFGIQANRGGLSVLTLIAEESNNASEDAVRAAASGPNHHETERVMIGGREFWRSSSQAKSAAGTMHEAAYAAATGGYILEFNIISFNSGFAKELQRSIESVEFFEASGARSNGGTTASAARSSVSPTAKGIDPGSLSGNVYTNSTLGFSYQFPQGWTIADKAIPHAVIETGHQAAWGSDPAAAREHEEAEKCVHILLWANQFPEGTPTQEMNPLIVLFAVDPICSLAVQLPRSIDDKREIAEAAQQFKDAFAGLPFIGSGQSSVSAFTDQGHLMLEISSDSTVKLPSRTKPLSLFFSVRFTELNGSVVAWAFVSGSQTSLEQLKSTKVNFTPVGAIPAGNAEER